MEKAINTSDEIERLQSLLEYEILDTEEEFLFDNITQMVASICHVPIALISLIDTNRQWFKSHYGLNAKETPREISFCGHAIQSNEIFIVEDANKDIRFSDNPLVMGAPHVIFYAGAPLITSEGHNIGTLCAIDHKSNKLTDEQKNLLKLLSIQIISIFEDRKKNRQIVDAAPNAMMMVNKNREIVFVNKYIETLVDYKKTELLGKKIELLIPERFHEGHSQYFNEYFSSPKTRAMGENRDLFCRKKDGREVPIEIGLNPLKTTNEIFVIASIIDITERKKIALLKNEFISTVSHELRTPLTSIRGSLGLISGKVFGELPTKIKNLIDIALKNVDRLTNLINDILDMEKIESGKMDYCFKKENLEAIIKQSIKLNEGYAIQYEVSIQLIHSFFIELTIDSIRIEQVLSNLISNAVKFSKKGGTVEISMTKENNQICVSVKDFGFGISDDFKEKIFSKFAQADSSDQRKKGGTGLGLSISKNIITSHNGTIGYRSIKGQGSEFYFYLPCL